MRHAAWRHAALRRAGHLWLAALLLALAGGSARAASGAGSSGASFLRIPSTARPVGMGGAYTGVAEGIYSLGYNPAGLSTIDQASIALTHNEMLLNIDYDYLALAYRIHPRTVLGGSFTYVSADDTRRNSAGTVIGEFQNSDLAAALTLSHNFTDALALGVTGRFLRSRLDSFSATAGGLDAGLRYRVDALPGVTVGAAVHNIGSDIKFISIGDPQPWTIRVGAAWRGFQERLLAASDVEFDREAKSAFHAGLEARVVRTFFARLGFTLRQEAEIQQAVKAGFGFSSSIGDIDYAYESFGAELGNNHRLTYGYHWGRIRPPEERVGTRRTIFESSSTEPARGPGYREVSTPAIRGPVDKRVSIAVGEFTNLTGDPRLDWLEPSLRAISEKSLDRTPDLQRVERRPDRQDGDFLIDGRFATAGERVGGEESLWVSIRLYDLAGGALIETRDGIVTEADLLRGTETLVGEILNVVPRDARNRLGPPGPRESAWQ